MWARWPGQTSSEMWGPATPSQGFPGFYCTALDLPPENWRPQDVVASPGVHGEARLAVQGTL